jgi:hypothetical protein
VVVEGGFFGMLKYRLFLFLGVTITFLSLAGCRLTTTSETTSTTPGSNTTTPPEIDLNYETIFGGNAFVGGPYKGNTAQIRVLTGIKSISEVSDMVYAYDTDMLSTVDFEHYFVLVAFNGWRGGIYQEFRIQKIWQSNKDVYVLAQFNDLPIPGTTTATILLANSSQYHAVKIKRTQLIRTGEIIVRLLDDLTTERAFTSAIIR